MRQAPKLSLPTPGAGAELAKFLLTEGIAAAVVVTLGSAARHRGANALWMFSEAAGVGAVVMSLAQCGLGLLLSGVAVSRGHARLAGVLFEIDHPHRGREDTDARELAAAGVALARGAALLPAGSAAQVLCSRPRRSCPESAICWALR